MKVITLWQPWASMVTWGWKPIETRTHARFMCLCNQTIGIHAGQKWDKDWYELAAKYLTLEQRDKIWDIEDHYEKGKILSTAFVEKVMRLDDEHSSSALIYCGFPYRFGLFLQDIKPLENPIIIKGKQGIWSYDL